MDRTDLRARQLSFARPAFAAALRGHLPARVRANLSHCLRGFRLLSVSYGGILGPAVRAGARRLPVRLQSAGTDHLQDVPDAFALRAAGRQRKRGVSGCRDNARDVPAASLAVPRKDRVTDLRIRLVVQTRYCGA